MASVPVKILRTPKRGAAAKRNLGVANSKELLILFVDDDIELNPESLNEMEKCLYAGKKIGGVGAYIENQPLGKPGLYSRTVWRIFSGKKINNYAGKCIGPLINIWPCRNPMGLEIQKTEWLSIACVLYRKEAIPDPPFQPFFTGYSFMEDVALSIKVAEKWEIGMCRDALVSHHSKPAIYRKSHFELHRMRILNRYLIMTKVKREKPSKAALLISFYESVMVPSHLFGIIKGRNPLPILWANVLGLGKIWGLALSGK